MTPFGLKTESIGASAILQLEGELDVAAAPQLREAVTGLIADGTANLTFDCSRLEFIDSTGLGVLIGARARALAANGSVVLDGVTPALQRLLVVTGIDGLFANAA